VAGSRPTIAPTSEILSPLSTVADLKAKLEGLGIDEFFEVSWKELVLRYPEAVVEDGLTEAYGIEEVLLNDISDAYVRETYAMYGTILEMLLEYDRDSLTVEQQVSYDVYEWYLEDRMREQEFMYYDYPATFFITAVHEGTTQFFTDLHPIADKQDAMDYVARLWLVKPKFEQLVEGLGLREEAGVVPPRIATQWGFYGVNNMAQTIPTMTPYYRTLESKLNALPDITAAEKEALLRSAQDAIEQSVLPAFQDLADAMQHLQSVAPDHDGVWQFPKGEAYYDYLLRHFTTTDLTADEIHELGLRELERIHAEMRTIFDELGYPQDESLPELFDRVALQGGSVSGEEVLTTYESIIEEAYANLGEAFDKLPQGQVVVIGDDYGGFYIRGSADGSRPGAFYANVSGGGEEYYGMPTLAYHEAIPGHHLQLTLAMEMDLPSLRRGVSFTGYVEGWALYAERLAWELGWYDDDPYGNLGRLQGEAFRAARLVVDTGLHAKRWTFEQALEFFVENVGYERGDIVDPEGQIARYVVWPGQSPAYLIGMIKILDLRQRAMDQLGDRFDLKQFHNVVLGNGAVPLEILERIVDEYIEAELNP
jgi:uncharacterized protein (DUF885 family)